MPGFCFDIFCQTSYNTKRLRWFTTTKGSPMNTLLLLEQGSTVEVNRCNALYYPPWSEPLELDLENYGPHCFDVATLSVIDIESVHLVSAGALRLRSERSGTLASLFGLREIRAIQDRGFAFYHRHFKHLPVVGLKALIHGSMGEFVPMLLPGCTTVKVCWYPLAYHLPEKSLVLSYE